MAIQLIICLSGHSGCNLRLFKTENQALFLRKDACLVSYNKRLKRQFLKQKLFRNSEVKTPKIICSGMENGIFYFDMEFVAGITLAEYMHKIRIDENVNFMSILFKALPVNESTIDKRANFIFQKKISSLANLKKDNSSLCLKEAFAKLELFDFSFIPSSNCCGDLTLENIILAKN